MHSPRDEVNSSISLGKYTRGVVRLGVPKCKKGYTLSSSTGFLGRCHLARFNPEAHLEPQPTDSTSSTIPNPLLLSSCGLVETLFCLCPQNTVPFSLCPPGKHQCWIPWSPHHLSHFCSLQLSSPCRSSTGPGIFTPLVPHENHL